MTYEADAVTRGLARVRARAALLLLRQALEALPLEEQLRLSNMTIAQLQSEFRGEWVGTVYDLAQERKR